jgi:hypothetical protein
VQLSESGHHLLFVQASLRTSNNRHRSLQLQRLSLGGVHPFSYTDHHRSIFFKMLVVSDSYTDGTLHKAVTGRGRIPDSQDLDFLNYFTVGEYIGQKYARPGRHLKHVQYDVEYSDHLSECGENWDETTREWGARQLQQLTALAVSYTLHIEWNGQLTL